MAETTTERQRVRLRELTPLLKRDYRKLRFRCPLCQSSFVTHQVLVGSDPVEDSCRRCSARALRYVEMQHARRLAAEVDHA